LKKHKFKYSIYFTAILTFFILVISTSFVEAKTYYTWVDKNGVTHITEFKDEIPKNRISTIKTFESSSKYDFLVTNYVYLKSNIRKILEYLVYLLIGIILLILLTKIIKSIKLSINKKKLKKSIENIENAGVSKLNKAQLKERVSQALEDMGYKLSTPNTQFDELIDYIGINRGERVAICIHESENLVSKIVVSEVDREKYKHSCDKTMIISTAYFEEDVAEYAKSIDCELIDKEKLSKLLSNN